MVLFPNCKINLGLNVLRKRSDGFHDIETVFYPVNINDAIEVIPSAEDEFLRTGLRIDDKRSINLCWKALELLRKDFPAIGPVKMCLHKNIPVGAGLGGGSADAAFTLKLLDQKFNLGLSAEKLLDYALQLGSDCPFFIINKPCFASGRGEFLEKIKPDLSAFKLLVVNPGIHINTSWAFDHIIPARPSKSIKEIIGQPVESWKDELKNDFEDLVFKQYPPIKKLKEDLYHTGAVFSLLSGSGSTVFGIFPKQQKPEWKFPSSFFVKELAVG
jgi:4-diphosphocytidyl-2-C-methyl-D-erythritol kinase